MTRLRCPCYPTTLLYFTPVDTPHTRPILLPGYLFTFGCAHVYVTHLYGGCLPVVPTVVPIPVGYWSPSVLVTTFPVARYLVLITFLLLLRLFGDLVTNIMPVVTRDVLRCTLYLFPLLLPVL